MGNMLTALSPSLFVPSCSFLYSGGFLLFLAFCAGINCLNDPSIKTLA